MNNQSVSDQDLYDIYGTWHVPFWQTQWFIIALTCLAVLLFLICLFFLVKKYFYRKKLSATQRALKDLEQLKRGSYQTRSGAQRAYFALSDILKKFFQVYYKHTFEGMTDNEMILALQSRSLNSHHLCGLSDIVHASQQVKYAKDTALHNDIMRDIQKSIIIITSLEKHD